MKVAVTGASGLIGTALVPHLRSVGHEVVRLVRRPASSSDEISWNPTTGSIDMNLLADVDGVVNLAGAGVGDHRWSDEYKRVILTSRVESTHTIATALAHIADRPRALVNGSAIGYYGDTGDRTVDESASNGTGFLAGVVRDWEAATAPAVDAGVRVTFARTGLVVAREGGAWARMFPLFKFGLGGKLGPGSQYWSWISLRDEVCALQFLLEQEHLRGPVNLTAPNPATNAEVTSAMGKVMGRPTLLPAPAFALKTVLGEFSSEVLGSIRVVPGVLENAQFHFQDPTIESAIRTALAA